jgi:hypothetical protein
MIVSFFCSPSDLILAPHSAFTQAFALSEMFMERNHLPDDNGLFRVTHVTVLIALLDAPGLVPTVELEATQFFPPVSEPFTQSESLIP